MCLQTPDINMIRTYVIQSYESILRPYCTVLAVRYATMSANFRERVPVGSNVIAGMSQTASDWLKNV
jgi:hypothetical protein